MAVVINMFIELVDDSLTKYLYNVRVISFYYNLCGQPDGLQVTISGYNDKMLILLERVLVSMRDLKVKRPALIS
ncbi:hypothetical protein F5884DRAFT_769305 [Xylogone sp. PMI_703]|nr:hypothetical protein F5884DRAFT_769305 [Xylogone sp. PMI_703]